MRLLPIPNEGQEPSEVVVLELAELQMFIDESRLLVDALERRVTDALMWLPHERREMPPTIPLDYLE